MKRIKDKKIVTLRSKDLNTRFSVIFPPVIWIFTKGRVTRSNLGKKVKISWLYILTPISETKDFEKIHIFDEASNFCPHLCLHLFSSLWIGLKSNETTPLVYVVFICKARTLNSTVLVFCFKTCSDLLPDFFSLLKVENFVITK